MLCEKDGCCLKNVLNLSQNEDRRIDITSRQNRTIGAGNSCYKYSYPPFNESIVHSQR